ncbi:MAG: family 20 glycosylhydrolase [Bacilli bacterium]|nr:family 20 glycosylhydrolase [Bacilli bacterium]
MKMTIYPKPKWVSLSSGKLKINEPYAIAYPDEFLLLSEVLNWLGNWVKSVESDAHIVFKIDKSLKEEAYELKIDDTRISVVSRDYAGAVNALTTLVQLNECGVFPKLSLQDAPDIKIRGFLFDVSRDRIPTLATFKHLVDKLTLMKYNHLELYVEGYPIEIPGFPDLPYQTPISIEEYRELEVYCRSRAIDLVPNINTFGHMTKFLALPQYRNLAENESGFTMEGYPFPPSTLNPLDPASRKLVDKIVKGMASISESHHFNLNGDEPFELSKGKSEKACLANGIGNVYFDFVGKTIELLKDIGKTPMMWGDVIRNHPEIIDRIPKDVIVIDWGYDYDYDFELGAKRFKMANIKFMLAPGTSSWNSFTSRLLDMKASTDNAVKMAIQYDGLGVLMTDWGDFGHPQPFVFSMPGLVYAGAKAWNHESSTDLGDEWMDKFIYDKSNFKAAAMITELASYSQMEDVHVHNTTIAFSSWIFADPDRTHPLDFKWGIWSNAIAKRQLSQTSGTKILKLIDSTIETLSENNDQIAKEILLGAQLLKLSVNLMMMKNHDWDLLSETLELSTKLMETYPKIWMKRYRLGGLESSISRLEVLHNFLIKWRDL